MAFQCNAGYQFLEQQTEAESEFAFRLESVRDAETSVRVVL